MNWYAEMLIDGAARAVYPGSRSWYPVSGGERQRVFHGLNQQRSGPHGWLPTQGGLVANLRVWENCLLPAAYFASRTLAQEETRYQRFLDALQVSQVDRETLSRASVAMLTPLQYRQALVLRVLMAAPEMILIETEWLLRPGEDEAQCYAEALSTHCPHAAWVALGPQAPAAVWRINNTKEPGHVPVA